jgi:predicted nucleic acid-binding Zn ribbon protein
MFACAGCGKLNDDDSQATLYVGLFFCSDECLEIFIKRNRRARNQLKLFNPHF